MPETVELLPKNRIDKLLSDSFELRVSNISLSIDTAKKALVLSQEIKYLNGEAYANSYLAFFYMIITKHQQAIPHIDLAINYFESVGDNLGLAFNYNTYGSIFYKTEDYHYGLKYLLKAYHIYNELGDVLKQSRTLKSIGAIYEFFKDYSKAKKTYLQCIELSTSIDDFNGISNALNPLSGLYLKEHNVKKATEAIEKSILLKQKSKDERGVGFALYGRAKVFDYLNKHEEAEANYLKSLEIHQNLSEHVGVIMTLNKLGKMYLRIGKNDLAKKRLEECIKEGDRSHHNLVIYKAYHSLYELAKKENRTTEALNYLEKHIEFKDKVQKRDVEHVLKSVQSLAKIEMLKNEAKWQKEKTEEVQKKNKELDNFVYKVSHDLRGPISSLLGLYNVVKLDVTDGKSIEYFDMYHEQIQRLESIILDFIDLTRLKESTLNNTPIDFKEIIDQCIRAYNYLPNFENIAISTNIDKAVEFCSDKSSVNSILQNLIENAIKYSNPRKEAFIKIDVSENDSNDQIILTIEDNGAGIHEEYKSKIFDMFFRANNNVQGSGLGLYILKTAVDRINGEVLLTSEYKKGSTFKVILPKTNLN